MFSSSSLTASSGEPLRTSEPAPAAAPPRPVAPLGGRPSARACAGVPLGAGAARGRRAAALVALGAPESSEVAVRPAEDPRVAGVVARVVAGVVAGVVVGVVVEALVGGTVGLEVGGAALRSSAVGTNSGGAPG